MASNAQVAAKLLRDAAVFFQSVAEQNAPVREALEGNAKTFRFVAELVENDPAGDCPVTDLVPEENENS